MRSPNASDYNCDCGNRATHWEYGREPVCDICPTIIKLYHDMRKLSDEEHRENQNRSQRKWREREMQRVG
jgi:hypothetical protein